MVSPLLRLAVWDALCDLEADMRYCAVLSAKKRRAHRFLRLGLLSSILVEAALLYGATQISLLFVVGVILGVFLALLTIWDAMSDNASDAATLKLVAATCRSLTSEMEVLWRKIETGFDDEAAVEASLKVVKDQWYSAMQWIQSEADLSLKRSTEEQANAEVSNRYVDRLPS